MLRNILFLGILFGSLIFLMLGKFGNKVLSLEWGEYVMIWFMEKMIYFV